MTRVIHKLEGYTKGWSRGLCGTFTWREPTGSLWAFSDGVKRVLPGMTTRAEYVTCKRCLRRMAKEKK